MEKLSTENLSTENCDESLNGYSLKLIYLTSHCETFVLYSSYI